MHSHTARVQDIDMRWQETGTGDPVILVHGIPTGPALWRHVAPLIEGRRVLAWEMVGYGSSIPEGRDRDISVAAQAGYLAAWMEAQGLSQAVVAGHDLGGGVAQILAVRHPEKVAGLFLTNAICHDSWPVPVVKAVAATGSLLKHAPDGSVRQFMKLMFSKGHDTEAARAAALEVHAPQYEAHDGAEAFVRQTQSLDNADTRAVAEALPRLGIPARIAWGVEDEFQTLDYGERLARDLAAPLRRIEGGRHFTPEDHPQIIAEEINALVREVDAAEAPETGRQRIG
ncbi:alpha/beta hydrolase [Marinovum sp.]|uniref:alpha/beta fold hydrolase n=1 Tax=Marinovum sp. TaxID=2024839 RepID=UPI002B26AEA4|nr:alpha/beta hydrolase [Marinovum sp.]